MTIGEAITAAAHWIWTIKLSSILAVVFALVAAWCFSKIINWREELEHNENLANENRFWRIAAWLSVGMLGVMSAASAVIMFVRG